MVNNVIKESDTKLFTPALHFDCISRWYFKKNDIKKEVSILRSDFKLKGWADWHTHDDFDQIYYIIRGRARVWMETEEKYWDVEAGDTIRFPKNISHKLKNTGEVELSLLAINI